MTHDEHGAPVRGERLDEPVDGVDVEVVRRLVEHEQLRRRLGQQQLRQRDPEALAARQRRDRPIHRTAADQEAREPVAQLAVGHGGCRLPHVLEHRSRLIQAVDALRQVADAVGVRPRGCRIQAESRRLVWTP